MTQKQLEEIAQEIREKKNSRQMSVREFINALNCVKRTSGNVWHINRFLENNQLKTIPYFENVGIDDGIVLSFKHNIKHQNFQLYSLSIDSYKNLKNFRLDFENTQNYTAFIGLNGSGKSNVLEAVSAIFYSLYHIAIATSTSSKYACSFKYTISYILNGEYFEVADGKLKHGGKITTNILPKNVIASYSGEDTRLWDSYYRLVYERYCSKLTADNQGFAPPFMFYLSKYQWEIALLVLLYSEDVDVIEFISNLVGQKKCTITIDYANTNFPKWEGTTTLAFVEKLKEKHTYTINELRNVINNVSFIDQSSTLFYYLYRSTVSVDNKLINKINIKFDDGSDLESLSEGEKKLILTNVIIHILATKDSLCLFDEPDSHIHLCRKNDLIKLIDSENRYSLVTTHSSVLAHKMRFSNLKFLNSGKLENTDKIIHLNNLSGGEINFIEGAYIATSKNIVIVEGTYDIKYIKKAIQVLGQKDSKYYMLDGLSYIPQGSAGNTESFFNDIIKDMYSNTDKILYVFDFDKAGSEGKEKAEKMISSYPKVESIYYQDSYIVPFVYKKGETNLLFIEDLFSENCYVDIVKEVHSKNKFKEFKSISQATHEKIKKHIENNYNGFGDDDFENFKPLLDKIMTIFNFS